MKSRVILGVVVVVPLAILLAGVRPGTGQDLPATGSATKRPAAPGAGGKVRGGGAATTGAAGRAAGIDPTGRLPPPMAGSSGMGGMPMMGMGMAGSMGPGSDPLLDEDFQLENQIQQILQDYSGTDEEQRRLSWNKVAELLDRQFTVRQERRENEIAEIEARVKRLREALGKRAEAKAQIIERRLNDLFSDAEGLGWGEIGGAPAAGGAGIGFPGVMPGRGFAPGGNRPGM